MKQVVPSEKIPIKLWLDDIEEGALEQAKNLANLPFAFKHIAIMPDAHQGYGMPIGGVLATENVIIPNAVGVDIGCGMCAIKFLIKEISTEDLRKIMGLIRSRVPVGFKKHSKKSLELVTSMPKTEYIGFVSNSEYNNAVLSVGTLGGGNHFIEFQKDQDGYIWIMIHSGSRNLGKKVCDYYNKLATELNEKWFSQVTKNKQLAFLPISDDYADIGGRYIADMNYCVDFALANRKRMMDQCVESVLDVLNISHVVNWNEMINVAHNYARFENHFGKNVMVHRKGATSAREGEVGIIPGSQGTKSYIVVGKGNPESFMSCSHGAGRLMSRKKAQNELDLEKEIKKLDDLGVIHGIRNKKDLDEASGAYKNIDIVMENQKDLVDILYELTPIAVIKG